MISPIGPVGDRPHRVQDLVGHVRGAAVDENGRVISDMHGDVAPGTEDYVDVRPDPNGFEPGFARCRLGARRGDPACGNGRRQSDQNWSRCFAHDYFTRVTMRRPLSGACSPLRPVLSISRTTPIRCS